MSLRSKISHFSHQMPPLRDWILFLLGGAVAVASVIIVAQVNRPLPLEVKKDTINIKWLPATVKHWQEPITKMAKKYNIDPDVLAIIVTLESGGYSKAVSEADAQGLMQVTPPTARDIASKYLEEPREEYDLFDPQTNIEFGAAYLAYLRGVFGEAQQGPSWNSTVELIAAGYNGGPGNAGKLYRGEGLTSVETVVYSRDAFNMWRERKAAKSPTFERWLERGGSVLVDRATAEQL